MGNLKNKMPWAEKSYRLRLAIVVGIFAFVWASKAFAFCFFGFETMFALHPPEMTEGPHILIEKYILEKELQERKHTMEWEFKSEEKGWFDGWFNK